MTIFYGVQHVFLICVLTVSHNHGNPIIYNIHKKLELCLESKMFITYENEQIRNISFKYRRQFLLTAAV